ncbi:DUF4158 domain-containing protein [Chryseobacterium indologenes]|uniref:DUF4158 domain-containing protein n=1 Tax=Chryseobacterium indologenes TaxID=253 RepID=UPI0009A22600|nr:DUF4158 domain-containing protein [Chryseobacterium indologenes]
MNHRYKKIIIEHFGISFFRHKEKQQLMNEAVRLFKKQKSSDSIFWILIEYLQDHRIEIPTYNALSIIIQQAGKSLDNEYHLLFTYIYPSVVDLLNKLFIKEQESHVYYLAKLTPLIKRYDLGYQRKYKRLPIF